MIKKQYTVKSIKELKKVAVALLEMNQHASIWAFYGTMGSGKTTFIQALGEIKNVKEQIASPTFNLINEYETIDGRILYHFDFYRIENIEEAINIGAMEYFDSGNLCLLEWPEKIEAILPKTRRNIYISINKNQERIIKIEDNA